MKFDKDDLKKLFKPNNNSNGEDNGQITIIGGSQLFHGAPILPLTVASRIVDMVFFASPEKSVGMVAEQIKSKLLSFIWIPWSEVNAYVEKSDAILIGPGFMRFHSEKVSSEKRTLECDEVCQMTKKITEDLLKEFPDKKWVIDAGSLQTIDPKFIPHDSVLTPNKKEFKLLFGIDFSIENAKEMSEKYKCIIVVKGPISFVFGDGEVVEVHGGNPGLTKGGTGDVQAGLTASLLAKNDPMLSACSASYIVKSTADELQKSKGIYYNADELASKIPEVLTQAVK
jgi:NAD(P)H-hydrate epimerase